MEDNSLRYYMCFSGEFWIGWMRIQDGEDIVYRKRTPHAQFQTKRRFEFDDAIEVSAENVPGEVRNALVTANRKVLRTKGKRLSKTLT